MQRGGLGCMPMGVVAAYKLIVYIMCLVVGVRLILGDVEQNCSAIKMYMYDLI